MVSWGVEMSWMNEIDSLSFEGQASRKGRTGERIPYATHALQPHRASSMRSVDAETDPAMRRPYTRSMVKDPPSKRNYVFDQMISMNTKVAHLGLRLPRSYWCGRNKYLSGLLIQEADSAA